MALEALKENRGVLRQLADNELAVELAPYLKDRPFARIGFDPERVSILPTYLPEDEEKYKDKWDFEIPGAWLHGEYYPENHPARKIDPWKEKVMEAYDVAWRKEEEKPSGKKVGDRMIVWQNPRKPRTNQHVLEVLAHESGHRGRDILEEYAKKKMETAREQIEELRKKDPKWHKNPLYKRLRKIAYPDSRTRLYPFYGGHSEEIAARIGDILTGSKKRASDSLDFFEQYYIREAKNFNKQTFAPFPKGKPDARIGTAIFGERNIYKDPITKEWELDTSERYGPKIPLEVFKELIKYDSRKEIAENWLKNRYGY